MPTEQWDRIKEIFNSALDLTPAERGPFLVQACAGEPSLQSEVERLLREHDQVGDFLAQPALQPAYSLAPGDLVAGRYLIRRLIGCGGMGEVYEAEDQLLNEAVALKTLRSDLAQDEGVARRFHREIQLARKVTHSNVCRVFEAGVHEWADKRHPPLRFFTMELLSGEPLSARIRRVKRLSRDEAFPLAVQMAEGLQAAHEMGIVHADFKSGNVFVIPGLEFDRAVITDFGLARIDPAMAGPGETNTSSLEARLVGTVAYMSPEQMTGEAITPASDIYSFGIVLFEMATGKLPFDSGHVIHAAVQRVSGEGVTVRSLVPDIDPRWEFTITRCLQKDPRRRFSSAGELADCFRTGVWRMPRPNWTRREWIRAGVTAGIPLGAAGGYVIWIRRPYQPQLAAVAWYTKGVEALHSMTYEAARKALEQAVAADPEFALAHASLARAYSELDYSERAKESMLRAMTVAQESRLSSADALRLRALQFLISGDHGRAEPLFQRLEQEAGEREKAAAAIESGWVAQQRGDTERAAAAYRRALKQDPRDAAAKLRLAFILGRQRQVDAALKTFKEAETLYSASSDYEGIAQTLYEQGSLLNRSSRPAEAMPVIEKALSVAHTVGSQYHEIRLQLLQSAAARNLGDIKRASDLAQQAVDAATAEKQDNLATSGLIDIGNLYLAVYGDPQTAEKYYRRALELAQRNKQRRNEARAQFQLGSLFEQSKPAEARKYLEAALPFYRQGDYRIELVRTMLLLGGVSERLAEFDESARILREALPSAVQLHDGQTEALVRGRLADALDDQGVWPGALVENEQAAKLLGSGSRARLNCAKLYWRLGRREDADRALSEVERALERKPNRHILVELESDRAEIAYQDGRLSDAKALCGRALSDAAQVGVGADLQARLISALILIQTRRKGGIELAASVIEKLEEDKLVFTSASARLSVAAAALAGGDRSSALRISREALVFLEPKRIWESVWRAHVVAARASEQPAEVEAHRSAARAALDQLRTLWLPQTLDGYLRRPDIRLLLGGIQL